MSALIEQLAKLLEVTIEQATLLYPVLREQFVWYKILDSLRVLLFLLSAGSVIGFLTGILCYDSSQEIYKPILKIAAIVLSISIFLFVVATIGQLLLAPDLMMIKEFL